MNLSIVIPVYNVEKYISQCLESAFALPYKILHEVICIDDGSTDNTQEVLNDFSLKYPLLNIIRQKHAGAAIARNTGIKSATGDYIFFLDSDDFIAYPNILTDIFYKSISQRVDITFFNAFINGTHPYITSMPNFETAISGTEMMRLFFLTCRTIPTPVWMQLYRRQFLLDHKFLQKKDSYHEDELFTPTVLYNARQVLCFNQSVVHYRRNRQGAVTTQFGNKFYNDWVKIGRDLYHYFVINNATEEEPFRQTYGVFFQLIQTLCEKEENINKYLTASDYKILKSCARTRHEIRCGRLAQINPKLMYSYTTKALPSIVRMAINKFF